VGCVVRGVIGLGLEVVTGAIKLIWIGKLGVVTD